MSVALVAAATALVALHLWCIADAVRASRSWWWVAALVIVPFSALAYLGIGPIRAKVQARRHLRRRALVDAREMREAKAALAAEDSRSNRLRLAGEYARSGRFAEAVPHYKVAVGERLDVHAGFRLANAQHQTGDFAGALETLEAMPPVPIQQDPEFVELLRARVLVALGRKEDAAAAYGAIGSRPPTQEAVAEYEALLLELGRTDEAARIARFRRP